MHNRQNALNSWLEQTLNSKDFNLSPLAGDASFRRYFRLQHQGSVKIIMDAPPNKETIEPFIAIANLLTQLGLRAPKIHAVDISQGFAMLEDFGDSLLFNQLNKLTADKLYKTAIDALILMQKDSAKNAEKLPHFNKDFIATELHLFKEWFLDAYLNIRLTQQEEIMINDSLDWLGNEVAQQPSVLIHRDYHSRNIMLLDTKNDVPQLGIIDFQDAMYGPYTYDLVSLLKDCYIQWPDEQVNNWLFYYFENAAITKQHDRSAVVRAFDLCGLQRHLKVLGIFSRLHLRDNKPNYLNDLPLTLHYVMACLESYEELQPFYRFMQTRIELP